MTLKEFIEDSARRIESIFDKQNGNLSQMFHFIDTDGKHYVLPAPRGDKDQSVAVVRVILQRANAVRVMVIDEAWILDANKSGAPSMQEARDIWESGGSIQHHPARTEAVTLLAEDIYEGSLAAYRPIIREPNSNPRLGELVFLPSGGVGEGRMIGLLPRGKLSS